MARKHVELVIDRLTVRLVLDGVDISNNVQAFRIEHTATQEIPQIWVLLPLATVQGVFDADVYHVGELYNDGEKEKATRQSDQAE